MAMGNDQPNRAIKNSPVKYISSIVAGIYTQTSFPNCYTL
jgi:hypothetical protein